MKSSAEFDSWTCRYLGKLRSCSVIAEQHNVQTWLSKKVSQIWLWLEMFIYLNNSIFLRTKHYFLSILISLLFISDHCDHPLWNRGRSSPILSPSNVTFIRWINVSDAASLWLQLRSDLCDCEHSYGSGMFQTSGSVWPQELLRQRLCSRLPSLRPNSRCDFRANFTHTDVFVFLFLRTHFVITEYLQENSSWV